MVLPKSNKLNKCIIFIYLIASIFLGGCATVYNPATGREEYVWIDTTQELQLGRQMANEVGRRYKRYEDLLTQARVNAIGQYLAKFSDRKDIHYHFTVLDGEQINAFALPGGFIYVFRGVVENAKSDAEIASVIAHEIGHIAARHPVKKMEMDLGYNLFMNVLFSGGKHRDFARYIDLGFNLIMLGYSREDEFLADRLSIRYLLRAGYNPYAVVSFLKRLQKMKDDEWLKPLVILSSHPYISQRIEAAQEELMHLKQSIYGKDMYGKKDRLGYR